MQIINNDTEQPARGGGWIDPRGQKIQEQNGAAKLAGETQR